MTKACSHYQMKIVYIIGSNKKRKCENTLRSVHNLLKSIVEIFNGNKRK